MPASASPNAEIANPTVSFNSKQASWAAIDSSEPELSLLTVAHAEASVFINLSSF